MGSFGNRPSFLMPGRALSYPNGLPAGERRNVAKAKVLLRDDILLELGTVRTMKSLAQTVRAADRSPPKVPLTIADRGNCSRA